MNRLIKYIPDSDLRLGYDGLNKKVPLTNLGKGEFVAFVNRAQNKIKLCTQNDMVAYYRHSRGKIDPRVIQHLPEYFNGTGIQYNKAIERVMKDKFPKFFIKKTIKIDNVES
jgi:hypothetical protein